jgi:NAD(P)-dependent dehydrogenase (short-subunit alcohol dehydrogenase family)
LKQVALVQGGSRGIGLALVEALLARADVDRVIATSRRPDASTELLRLADEHGDALGLLPLDVRDETSIVRVGKGLADLGVNRLHWLVNCAGVLHDEVGLTPEKRLEDVRSDALKHSFEVNAIGPVLVVKHLLPFLCHDERAIVANLSARVGSIGDNRLGGWYAYRASKAAQNMLTRTLAIELRRRAKNVICVALHPGTVDTALSLPFQRNVPEERLFDPRRAAAQLLGVLDGCTPEQSGSFLAWNGEAIPW